MNCARREAAAMESESGAMEDVSDDDDDDDDSQGVSSCRCGGGQE